jgi:hypothetical protein
VRAKVSEKIVLVVAGREVTIYYLLDSAKTLLASARRERELIPQLRALAVGAPMCHMGQQATSLVWSDMKEATK